MDRTYQWEDLIDKVYLVEPPPEVWMEKVGLMKLFHHDPIKSIKFRVVKFEIESQTLKETSLMTKKGNLLHTNTGVVIVRDGIMKMGRAG